MKILPPPGPQRTRQLALLGVLSVLAIFVVIRYSGELFAGRAPSTPASAPATPPAKAATAPAVPGASARTMPQPIDLDQLEAPSEPPESSRNPFRYYVPPPPPPPPRPVVTPPPAPPPAPVGPPPVPPISLNFIGRVVGNDGKVIATLSDGKGGLFVTTAGQIVDGRYRVVSIGQESLMIEYVNGTGRRTLPLR